MGAGRRRQTFRADENARSSSNCVARASHRNLEKGKLSGVVFGCTHSTIKECLSEKIFGLPAGHFCYVKNIEPGLKIFLFNYSDRLLYGIFEAVSKGEMNINPYGWTTDGSRRTDFPAQVRVCIRMQCQPLREDMFKPIIKTNYHTHHHFWFELDCGQTKALTSLFKSSVVGFGTSVSQKIKHTAHVSKSLPLCDGPAVSQAEDLNQTVRQDITSIASSSDGDNELRDAYFVKPEVEKEKDILLMKLKELALKFQNSFSSSSDGIEDGALLTNMHSEDIADPEASTDLEKEEDPHLLSEHQSIVAQVEAKREIQKLKDNCMSLDLTESLYLIGGIDDGQSCLSRMDLYCPSQDLIKSLEPMRCVRSYATAVHFNGEIYVIGGGDGHAWYNSVESYCATKNEWTLRPSLIEKKGSLAGAALNDKLFAIGGGNGLKFFSDVEMLDLDIGRWISTQSMLQKRFALAAAELNGVLYATGGFDGNFHLNSAERFDPREHSWRQIPFMNVRRSCHSLVVLNEKLYALGGFDGNLKIIPSVEVFDPRLGAWTMEESMNQPRACAAAGVVNGSISVIGGVKFGETLVDTVESYKEGKGWKEMYTRVGKRCYLLAIAPQ